MILKSFGCSFTYGTDLADAKEPFELQLGASNSTWPALLAQHHSMKYNCLAFPGAGNLRIAEMVLFHLAPERLADFYIVNWSWIDRFDYSKTLNQDLQSHWHTILPVDQTSEAKFYYKNLHSQYRDKLTSLINIKLIIDSLKQAQRPFIMTCMDPLVFETEWHSTPATQSLQDYCRPYITQFNGKSFLEYSNENGHKISPGNHPLEAAHRAGFELINSYNLV